jgi:hypothetical protein
MRIKEGTTEARVEAGGEKYVAVIDAIVSARNAVELEIAVTPMLDGAFFDMVQDLSSWNRVLDRFDAVLAAGILLCGETEVLGDEGEWELELGDTAQVREATLMSIGWGTDGLGVIF